MRSLIFKRHSSLVRIFDKHERHIEHDLARLTPDTH
jgi:hypothetical protein